MKKKDQKERRKLHPFYATDEEYERYVLEAKKAGLTSSAYIRFLFETSNIEPESLVAVKEVTQFFLENHFSTEQILEALRTFQTFKNVCNQQGGDDDEEKD